MAFLSSLYKALRINLLNRKLDEKLKLLIDGKAPEGRHKFQIPFSL